MWLNKVRMSALDLQYHAALLPNDRNGMSVMTFWVPAMCWDINGDVPAIFSRRANACTNCMATSNHLAAIRLTHPAVGELSLNKATYFARREGHTSSITKNSNNKLAISKSEFVIFFARYISRISSGHTKRNTVGIQPASLLTIMPPTPCVEESLTPI